MADFEYRTLVADDAVAWGRLYIEGTRDFPMGFLTTLEEAQRSDEDRRRTVLSQGAFRGVFNAGTLLGFCGYRPGFWSRMRHRAEIGPFFVTADAQGSGAASAMMQGVIDEAQSAGLAQLDLYVDTENHRPIAFYEKHGFVLQATHRDSVRIDGVSRDDHFYVLRL